MRFFKNALFLNRKTRKSENHVFFTFLDSVETNGKTDAFEQKNPKIHIKFTFNFAQILMDLMEFWTLRKGVPL